MVLPPINARFVPGSRVVKLLHKAEVVNDAALFDDFAILDAKEHYPGYVYSCLELRQDRGAICSPSSGRKGEASRAHEERSCVWGHNKNRTIKFDVRRHTTYSCDSCAQMIWTLRLV